MKSKIYPSIFITSFILLSVGHITARTYGWYAHTFWGDIILHIIAGIAIASGTAILLNRKQENASAGFSSVFLNFLFLILSATFFGYLWEVYEYSMWHFFPNYMQYSTALSDALSDIGSGSFGGLGFGLLYVFLEKRNPKH